MDFLDPKKRRHYHIRLITGYILVAIVMGLATYLLVQAAKGFGYNAKTGEVVQNGLLFVDSNPGKAEIFINGQDSHKTTSSRMIIPVGSYTLTLKKQGYRDWSRQIMLSEENVVRYVYPFLFPTTPKITNLKTYSTLPGLISQSPSQRWLLVQNNKASSSSPVFDEFDTTTLDQAKPLVQPLSFPSNLLTNYSAKSVLKEVEWSTDNNNVLLEHVFPHGTEFVVFNRANPSQSFNVNRVFKVTPAQVNLFNKRTAELYIYDKSAQSLRLGDTSSGTLAQPLLKNVLAYKPFGTDLILYVTDAAESAGRAAARIWDRGQTYPLYEFTAGSHYLIDFAQFNGHFYYAAGSDKSDRVNIYKDPLNSLTNPGIGRALPFIALQNPGADKIGFSHNTRFIETESRQRLAVYDFETSSYYQYSIKDTLAADLDWMDGHRLIGQTGGSVLVMDYDGTNKQTITPTAEPGGALFSANYRHMLVLAPSSKTFVLQDVDMRAGNDLPASKR